MRIDSVYVAPDARVIPLTGLVDVEAYEEVVVMLKKPQCIRVYAVHFARKRSKNCVELENLPDGGEVVVRPRGKYMMLLALSLCNNATEVRDVTLVGTKKRSLLPYL